MKASVILATALLAYGAPASAAELWTCRGSSTVIATDALFHFELSPPDFIETENAYPSKEHYRILLNNDDGIVATYFDSGAPQPEAKVEGGVHGFTIVINKRAGVFWYGGSILTNGRPDRPFTYQSVSGKCQKG